MNKKTAAMRLFILLLAMVFVCPINAHAAEPRASYYLDSYNAYPYAAGGGDVQIWFTVTADTYMDDIGSLSIEIYECATNSSNINDWEWVDSFNNGNTPSMLGHDKIFYQSYVECNGTVGMWYKAYVCIYAGKDGAGDNRYFWTAAVQAT